MIIKTIERSLSREYNVLCLKEWKGARMVAEINETEDEYECGKELERKVERQLEDKPEYVSGNPIPRDTWKVTDPPPPKDYKAIERMEILIDDAKTIEELAIYKEEASKHGLVEQYMNRLKQLS